MVKPPNQLLEGSVVYQSPVSDTNVIGVPALTESAKAVLKAIATTGPSTRPQLSALLNFSKPTMSAAVSELERYGFLVPAGINRGGVGRTSVTYSIGHEAGLVIGIDCGTTQISAIACGIDGTPVAEIERATEATADRERFEIVETVLADLLAKCADRAAHMRMIVIALPNMISPSLERLPQRALCVKVLKGLHTRYGVPILLENNTNCAALAEYHHGAARNHSFAIYMQIGVKVGMGIVIDGKLFRGFKGGAGEISHLPFPWSRDEQPVGLGVETYLGSAALLQRTEQQWAATGIAPPQTTNELVSRSLTEEKAAEIITEHARNIGNLAAACVSIIDPELIVVGGGVGQNAIFLREIQDTVKRLCWPVDIVVSELSSRATVLGAARLAMDFTLARLIGEEVRPAFVYTGSQTSRFVSV